MLRLPSVSCHILFVCFGPSPKVHTRDPSDGPLTLTCTNVHDLALVRVILQHQLSVGFGQVTVRNVSVDTENLEAAPAAKNHICAAR